MRVIAVENSPGPTVGWLLTSLSTEPLQNAGRKPKKIVYIGPVIWVQNILLTGGAISAPLRVEMMDWWKSRSRNSTQVPKSPFEMLASGQLEFCLDKTLLKQSLSVVPRMKPSFQKGSDWDRTNVGVGWYLFCLLNLILTTHDYLPVWLLGFTATIEFIFPLWVIRPWLSVCRAHQGFWVAC